MFFKNGKSRSNLVVQITVEGPAGDFLELAGFSPPSVMTFELAPDGPGKRLRWDVKDLLPLINSFDVDQLYAAQIRIKAYPKTAPGVLVVDQTINVFRFLSVLDPEGQTNRAYFYRAFADGTGGFVREKLVEYHLPSSVQYQFFAGDPFDLRGPISGDGVARWRFDPEPLDGQPKAPLIDHIRVSVLTPQGEKLIENPLVVTGEGYQAVTLGLNRDGFLNAYIQLFQELFADAAGTVYLTDPAEQITLTLSESFRQQFADFMPPPGSTANLDPTEILQLRGRLSAFFDEILARVKQDFDYVNNGAGFVGFVVIDGVGDNNVFWDAELHDFDLGTANFGSTNASSMTAALTNVGGLGRVVREFKAGQVLNQARGNGSDGLDHYGSAASVSAALFMAGVSFLKISTGQPTSIP